MNFKIKNCHIIITPLFAVMISLVLLLDKTGAMLFGLLAVVIHESGHLIFMFLTNKNPQKIVFQLGGIIVKSQGFTGYNSDFLVSIGGCLFNFLTFCISAIFYYNYKNEMLLIFSASNLGLMIFNLFPVNGLDGMDLIRLKLLKKHTLEKVNKICSIVSLVFLVVSLILSLYFAYKLGLNLTIIISLLYLVILTLLVNKY